MLLDFSTSTKPYLRIEQDGKDSYVSDDEGNAMLFFA